ncbi:MAG: flippase-like domain-containing protein [Chloroflexi bacterium]|nr:flippase-like domain-containing protein [Chloroflexota bacterium]
MPKKRLFSFVIWALIILLFWWAWRDISFPELGKALGRFTPFSLGILFLANAAILLLFGSRWWLIVRALGYKVSYFSLAKYRLASFGVSYFTPGPQFGGEPLQVYFLHKYHHISVESGLASVSLDKLLEMLANFTFLTLGIALILWQGLFFENNAGILVFFSAGIVILLLSYLLVLLMGKTPLSWIFNRLPLNGQKMRPLTEIRQTLLDAESQIGKFSREEPRTIIFSTFLSTVIWLVLFGEYALALRFLGLETSLINILAIIIFARLAFLTPLPGGLGALEAGQVFAMQSLGFDPILGVSMSLFIRVRDSFFALLGLWIGGIKKK